MSAGDRFECGVCWHVYDPAEGDTVGGIPIGTAFASLPETWRCPHCDSAKARFLALNPDGGEEPRIAALAAAYRAAEAGMRGLEIYNPALAVDLAGFDTAGPEGDRLGIVLTPWFLNLVLLPGAEPGAAPGEKLSRLLPAGVFEFVVGRLDGVGTVLSCSLLSPVFEFEDQASGRLAAEAALRAVLTPEKPVHAAVGRRALLLGSGA